MDREIVPTIAYKSRNAQFHIRSKIRSLAYSNPNSKVYPINLSIETTSKCNSRCVVCPRTVRKPNRRDRLTPPTIVRLIHQTPHLIFQPSGFGEPLLDENIGAYIVTAHGRRRMTRLITNASLLDSVRAKEVMEANLDILVLSIDAADKETYEAISPGPSWETTLSNIRDLKQIRNHRNFRTYLSLNIVKQKANESEIDDIVRFWYPFVDSVRVATATRHWKEISKRPPPTNCLNPWKSMMVLSNGEVPLCLRDVEGHYSLGNVLKQSPMKIWNSLTARAYRTNILDGNPPEICHYCDSFRAYDCRIQNGKVEWKLTKEGM